VVRVAMVLVPALVLEVLLVQTRQHPAMVLME
jgi:hypothetical protein